MHLEYWQLLIGTISGFIIAFLAEPIKTFFTNRAKIQAIREAIYREIASNYLLLRSTKQQHSRPNTPDTHNLVGIEYVISNLHQECFQHIIKENPIDFYQLKEAPAISHIYFKLFAFIDYFGRDAINDEDKSDNMHKFVDIRIINFGMDEIAAPMVSGLDLKLLRKISEELADELDKNKRHYIQISLIENGSQYIQQLMDTLQPGEDPNKCISPLVDELVDEIVEGKNPEKVFQKLIEKRKNAIESQKTKTAEEEKQNSSATTEEKQKPSA